MLHGWSASVPDRLERPPILPKSCWHGLQDTSRGDPACNKLRSCNLIDDILAGWCRAELDHLPQAAIDAIAKSTECSWNPGEAGVVPGRPGLPCGNPIPDCCDVPVPICTTDAGCGLSGSVAVCG